MSSAAGQGATIVREAKNDDGGLRYLDVRRLLVEARRRWWLILGIVVVVLATTYALYRATDPRYSATARVAIERRPEALVVTEGTTPALTADSAVVDTEVQKLRSPELAAATVDRLRLHADPAYATAAAGSDVARRQATSRVLSGLTVRREGTSYAISVTYVGGDPVRTAQVVNTLVGLYRSGASDVREADRTRQLALIEGRLGRLRSDMAAAEGAVARYRIANGIIDATQNSTVRQEEVSALNTELAQARAAQAESASRLSAARAAQRRGSGEAIGQSLNSSVVTELRRQQAQLSVQAADLRDRYGPQHPDVQRIDGQLAAIQGRVGAEVGRIVSSLSTDAQASAGRTASLQGSINRVEGEVAQQTSATVRLAELERNAASARDFYQAFLSRYRALLADSGASAATASIISLALAPSQPDSPSATVYLLLGIVTALLLVALALLLFRFFANGLETSADVDRELGVPLIGSVPDLRTVPGLKLNRRDPVAPSQHVIDDRGSLFDESIRGIRAAIARSITGGKIIAVTSAVPGEGKTSLAMSLARSAGLAGQRVLLVDTDLRRRASSRSLADNVPVGLVEVLAGTRRLQDAIVRDTVSGAFLLPQSAADTDKYDAISTERLETLFIELRREFDLVILDCAPVLAVAESRIVAAAADAVIVAVRWRRTPVRTVELGLERLEQFGARVTGVVLSLVNVREQSRISATDASVYRAYREYRV